MCKPSTYLVITYFFKILCMYETCFIQNWLPRWNQILTQLRFIHNWVIIGIQCMVHWHVLVDCGTNEAILKLNSNFNKLYKKKLHMLKFSKGYFSSRNFLCEGKWSIFWNIWEYSTCQNWIFKMKQPFGTDLVNLLFNYCNT